MNDVHKNKDLTQYDHRRKIKKKSIGLFPEFEEAYAEQSGNNAGNDDKTKNTGRLMILRQSETYKIT